MKKVVLMFSVLLVLLLSGCNTGYKIPYLELKNDTGYTIALRMNYVQSTNDFRVPEDRATEKWLRNGQSCVYEIDKTGHYDDIVNIPFWIDDDGDGTAEYNRTWHMDFVSNYPDNGYVFSRVYLDDEGKIETTMEVTLLERSVMNSGRSSDMERVSSVSLDGENVIINE